MISTISGFRKDQVAIVNEALTILLAGQVGKVREKLEEIYSDLLIDLWKDGNTGAELADRVVGKMLT
jgi:hypothetical protein